MPNAVAKRGITMIESFAFLDETTLEVFLQLLTGRTHQIRYHLSHHGLPIIGDYLYGKPSSKGMQLTAWKLVFEDLDGKEITLTC